MPKKPTVAAKTMTAIGGTLAPPAKAIAHVHAAGDQSLEHGDGDRVRSRDLAGKIVIQAPGHAGTCNRQRPEVDRNPLTLPRQEHGAGEDRHGAEQEAAVDVLPINQPSDGHGGEALQIQKEGAA